MLKQLPRQPSEVVAHVSGLYAAFREGSRMVLEKYRRNHELYLEQAMGKAAGEAPRAGTPVLYATYRQELSDAMEMIPEAVFLARRPDDEQRAQRMTALNKAVMERIGFSEQYLRICEYRARYGTGYSEIYVENGQVQVRAFDPRAILPDPLCEDMQQGRALLKISRHSPEYYAANYEKAFLDMLKAEQQLEGFSEGEDVIPMVTACFKERKGQKTLVHMVKVAAGQLLYDSRNDRPEGMFLHGEYPFVSWHYDRIPGTPWGFGSFDYLAPVQRYVDKLDTMVMQNLARAAKPRLIVNRSAGIDVDQLRDENEEIIEADRIDDGALRWQPHAQMPPFAVDMLNMKIEMLKRESGQNASSRGEVAGSGMSGTAISMLQAAGSKRANLSQFSINNAYMQMVRQVVSDMIEYCPTGESFREGDGQFILFDPGDAAGAWEFDLSVRLQRMPQYQSVYQNQLLMQLVQMQAMPPKAALELMDIEDKPSILSKMAEFETRSEEEHEEAEVVS